MANLSNIFIQDYSYELPHDKIAQFPLEKRDQSKLLVCVKGKVYSDHFNNIHNFLPENSLLVFNNTKVIRARLIFYKETGAKIEIFCLEPIHPSREIQTAFEQTGCCIWKCFVGNKKKWKEGKLIKEIVYKDRKVILTVQLMEKQSDTVNVEFCWQPDFLNFSEILNLTGLVPLPPYISREAIEPDKYRYQTVYAKHNGSVAAPTAGLHFTNNVFESLDNKNIQMEYVTLHVGAGTFKPVISESVNDHIMHIENIAINKKTIESLIYNSKERNIAVGTTSIRTLESLYWFGVKLLVDKLSKTEFKIQQWDPYLEKYDIDVPSRESLESVLYYMSKQKIENLRGETQLLIAPGYNYKIINGIITNFHQPRSTLLLLVAAYIGSLWKEAYEYALKNDFRFLSYGDSCLFLT